MGEPDHHCTGTIEIFMPYPHRSSYKPCDEGKYLNAVNRCPLHCEYCLALDNDLKANINKYSYNIQTQYWKPWFKHLIESHNCMHLVKSTTHEGNGKYKGPFAFTLTKSPQDDISVEQMVLAVRKIMAQQSCPVKHFAWYLEYKPTDTDPHAHPHIHGMYETETKGRIEKKHWKRAWSIWDESIALGQGFRGGYHRPVKDGEGYSNYINKDASHGNPCDNRIP